MGNKKILGSCDDCTTNNKQVEYCTDFVADRKSQAKFCKECDARIEEKYKLCILAAGKGTRNTSIDSLHKSLLPIENKAVISHIIKSVPNTVEIVIAVGYKSDQVKSYVKHVFPRRDITFVDIDNFDGPGSGPGLSLLKCKEHLQTPFIFTSADTIVKESFVFDELEENWLGVSHVEMEDSLKYCLVKGSKYLDKLYFGTGNRAYIGMAGIYDYKDYWKSLEDHKIIKDEYQVIHGFDGMDKIRLIDFTWFDTGNDESYENTRKHFPKEVVAVKNKESIFIDEGKVIKYFTDSDKVTKRIKRTEFLNGYCPKVTKLNDNMYSYDHVPGKLFSNILDDNILKDILSFYHNKFSIKRFKKSDKFLTNCIRIYKTKTYDRIKFFENSRLDKIEYINGVKVSGIKELLDRINWDSIYKNAIPSYFHGDFQPENIIHDGNDFKLIDWRESFGDSLDVGDLYYDLGKLYHALIINGQIVLKKGYEYSLKDNNAYISYITKSNLLFLLNYFEKFCKNNNLDWDNVELLGILQYIGICSLYQDFHEGKYGEFLFLLGKYLLTKKLNNERIN
jgi:GTP:adenosylcobinamide-phosphate guanylyltransferase|tara:strand:+ start:962 stop:2650 length:1689 start_codon:yes stop_codon:yes gene_type:complete